MINTDWIECSKEEYDFRDRINYRYSVDESDDSVTYYRQKVLKVYGQELFNNKQGGG